MLIFLIIISIQSFETYSSSIDIKDYSSILNILKTVDRSNFCYRKWNVIYKEGIVITGTPFIPLLPNNESDKSLIETISIIDKECFTQ